MLARDHSITPAKEGQQVVVKSILESLGRALDQARIAAIDPTAIGVVASGLSNRASMLDKKIEHISAKNIRGRISSYLLDTYLQTGNKDFVLTMKRHELADYLNIPRPSLSREMGLMRDDGIIEFEGSHITVNDALKLEKSIQ